MTAPIGPTLETTYTFQLRHEDGTWAFYSQGEYLSEQDVRTVIGMIYGGAFAAADMHRVIKIERTVI
jgi:hypothetical protein